MLSPREWHKKVPRDVEGNLRWRIFLLERCRKDPGYRSVVRRMCRDDILFYINSFVYQFNPLLKADRVGPFITWPFQERAIVDRPGGVLWCYEKDRTAVCEKSRDMGATWLFEMIGDWLCLFHKDIQVLDISRSADAVDSASKNSLFAKVRFIHKYLPGWLSGPIADVKMNFSYGWTGSEKTGEASTGRSGAGGRASVAFVDEFSEIKEDAKVRQNTASIADCRFFNGTHLDVGTEFYQLTQTPEIVKIQMHWTRHPRKNQNLYSWDLDLGAPQFWAYEPVSDKIVPLAGPPRGFPEDYAYERQGKPLGGPHPGIRSPWYDKKVIEIGDDQRAAMELDINPTGAASQFYNGIVIQRLLRKCREPVWRGEIEVCLDTARPRELAEHPEGPLVLWLTPGLASDGKLTHVPKSEYKIAADLGWGRGKTPSCLSIFDCRLGAKVGAYTDYRKDPKEMARVAVGLSYLFAGEESAELVWETPGPGLIFGDEVLKELNYRRIYWRTDPFRDDAVASDTPGWNAAPGNKNLAHGNYRSALASGEFVNPDAAALEETLAYMHDAGSVTHPKAKKNADPGAEGTSHGDRVVADMLAWLLAKRAAVRPLSKPEVVVPQNSILGRRQAAEAKEDRGIWA